MIRLFDIILSSVGLVLAFPVLLFVLVLCVFDTGSPIFRQKRIGRNQKIFILVKFRTMEVDSVDIASHMASRNSITIIGKLLRKTKLDELPQLWNVLKGEMSLVGPRPCLLSQDDLINERERRGVFSVRPGITGLSQVNGIDMSTPKLLAETDAKMVTTFSLNMYITLLLKTLLGGGSGDGISS